MPYHLFQYPLPGPAELTDLNAFLASHRIAAVQHYVMQNGQAAQLVFVVQVVDGAARPSAPSRRPDAKIDYRAVLSAEDFALFSALRDERRKIAEGEGVPVYTIFSNAQLALLVEHKVKTSEEMLAIEGIGAARVERYAKRILPLLGGSA